MIELILKYTQFILNRSAELINISNCLIALERAMRECDNWISFVEQVVWLLY